MPKRYLLGSTRVLPRLIFAATVGLLAAGCTVPFGPSNGSSRTTTPATTDTRVAWTGHDVAMVDLFGDWFYVLRTSDGDAVFTQRGDFTKRSDGKIIYQGKWYVQGFRADETGTVETDKLRDLRIVLGQASPVRATSEVSLDGNINPDDMDVAESVRTSFKAFDAEGKYLRVYVVAELTGIGAEGSEFLFDVRLGAPDGTLLGRTTFRFDDAGDVTGQSVVQISETVYGLSFDLDVKALTASSRKDTAFGLASQDGLGAGSLQGYAIRNDGGIVGQFTNGLDLLVGQFVIASFAKPESLEPVPGRSDLFVATEASGPPRPAISVAK